MIDAVLAPEWLWSAGLVLLAIVCLVKWAQYVNRCSERYSQVRPPADSPRIVFPTVNEFRYWIYVIHNPNVDHADLEATRRSVVRWLSIFLVYGFIHYLVVSLNVLG